MNTKYLITLIFDNEIVHYITNNIKRYIVNNNPTDNLKDLIAVDCDHMYDEQLDTMKCYYEEMSHIMNI